MSTPEAASFAGRSFGMRMQMQMRVLYYTARRLLIVSRTHYPAAEEREGLLGPESARSCVCVCDSAQSGGSGSRRPLLR